MTFHNPPHPLSSVQFGIEEIIIGALLGFGASQAFGGSHQPKPPATPPPPDLNKAQTDATQDVNKQRREALASGGLTDYTGGSGIILGTDVSHIGLIGS